MGYFEEQFGMHVQSKTKESQTAVFGDVRISVLTSRLLRVETMNAAKAFCDQPTQKVWYRDFEQPRFDASQEGQMLTVRTEQAIFHYNLRRKRMESITLRGGRTVTDFESGTCAARPARSDQSTGSVPLTKGVISKDGVQRSMTAPLSFCWRMAGSHRAKRAAPIFISLPMGMITAAASVTCSA